VPAQDADAMTAAVLDVLRHPDAAKRLGRNAVSFARERFDVERLVSDIDHLYRELLAEKSIQVSAEQFHGAG